ncbi:MULTISPECIES: xanthine permease [unclassified Exiguobacterium]|uniref:xanthine permease n=1 Tax=unclassified Exiguobacterium TaxID=2644629 RepID=UPI00103EEA54|nr:MULTISPECIES: xanthine permease [unclassified Exiguobacterium]TCI48032.1 xanthine permease [Exiguobacterium sp. SH5S32]TCI54916.1 xanthine permease [Exiguobacterium sp. SH1S4]TCI74712.1 xanthine permease [Exiguobacterium sp. SH1S1]
MNDRHVTPWFVKGDLNGFFGLFSNVLTNLLAAIGLLVFAINMPGDIVYGKIVPATAVAVGLGGIILAIQARRLSQREGRDNVTAMPYGISVPHYFVVAFAVMLPVYVQTNDWMIAWAVGVAWNIVQGLIMTLGAFIGPFIQKYIPRSAMLASLAGIALTYIAMNPLGQVYTTPYIGLLTLVIVLAGWLAHKRLPGNMPAGLMAIAVGMVLAWATGYMDFNEVRTAAAGFSVAFPSIFGFDLLAEGFALLAPFLPAAIPLAIYDFLESLDNIESASADGDHYPTTVTMLVPGLLTLVGAVLGSVYPMIIYIGHPGWKKAGARVGYSLATGVGVMILAFLGLLPLVLSVIPLVALLPILVYIAMVIGAQAFGETEKRHIPALIIALMPFVASYIITQINNTLGAIGTSAQEVGYATLAANGIPYLGWRTLGSADILVSMLLATIVIYIIDKKFRLAAVYAGIAALLSFFGIIHSAEIGIGVGMDVTIGYLVAAAGLVGLSYYRASEDQVVEQEKVS